MWWSNVCDKWFFLIITDNKVMEENLAKISEILKLTVTKTDKKKLCQ